MEDVEAEELLMLMDSAGLDSWLEPGVKTRMNVRSSTTMDLVLAPRKLTERMISCEVIMETHVDSDHLPIRTVINVETQEVEETTRRRCWKSMDVKKFTDFLLANQLGKRWMGLPELCTPQQIDSVVEHLVDINQQGVQKSKLRGPALPPGPSLDGPQNAHISSKRHDKPSEVEEGPQEASGKCQCGHEIVTKRQVVEA